MTARPIRRVRARWYANLLLATCVALALAAAGPVLAQPPEAAGASTTAPAECKGKDPEQVYRKGYELWTNKEQHKACDLFFLSYRCGRSSGNTFNWARCNEQTLDNPAEGYNLYLESAELAAAQNQTVREKAAREAADKLAVRVTLVTVHLAEGPLPYGREDLKVTLNNQPIAATDFGKTRAVRTGSCRVEASAKGHKTWRYTALAVPGRPLVIKVPRLEAKPEPLPPPPVVPTATAPAPTATTSTTSSATPPPQDDPGMNSTKLAGYITGGVGIALIVVGSVLGGVATSYENIADENCKDKECDLSTKEGQEGWGKIQDAEALAAGSTATLVVGFAAVGTGLVLLLTSGSPSGDKADDTAVRFAPHVSERGGGLVVVGRF